ncbi:MAG: glutamine amidotransferase [Chloroflexota bacterium]
MARAIAVRHVHFEDLGILGPILCGRGYEVEYRDPGVEVLDPGELAAADLLILLGAPISSTDREHFGFLDLEVEAARRRTARPDPRPTLGVCLGAQIMSLAAGAGVRSTGRKEIGYSELMLTPMGRHSALAELGRTPVLHWHGDQFAVPDGAERLAATAGFPNQAYSRGPNVLALQFHLEADHTQIERWLIGHFAELEAAGVDPRVIRADARRYGPRLRDAATRVFARWLDGLTG